MKSIKIVFLVLPQTQLLDFSGPDQVFSEALDLGANLKLEYCSVSNQLNTSAGLLLGNLKHYNTIKIKKGDFLILPGTRLSYLLSGVMRNQKKLLSWINDAYKQGAKIAGIGSGTFLLAQTGLLDGKKCTTHWKYVDELKRLFPKVQVSENVLFTEDSGIYTSAGILTGIDLALHIIEKMKGEHFSEQVARELVMFKRINNEQSHKARLTDFRNHIHHGIHKVQDYMLENTDKNTSLNKLAKLAGMSSRNFTRVFKKETRLTVNEFLTLVRVEKIKTLVRNPDYNRLQIAKLCGLKSERQVSRLLKK